jgi:hypothetical protein
MIVTLLILPTLLPNCTLILDNLFTTELYQQAPIPTIIRVSTNTNLAQPLLGMILL